MDTEHAREYEEHGIQAYRIERGAEVIGTDGSLGTVEQIVVDGETSELQSLVVRGEAGMVMELPASRIESATGEQVYLSIGKADLAEHPELARPFKPELYIPVDQGAVVSPGEVIARDPTAPVLTEMEEDAIEIATPSDEDMESGVLLTASEGADIGEQPTVILGPDLQPAQPASAPPSPGLAAGGLAGAETAPPAPAAEEERPQHVPDALPDLTPETLVAGEGAAEATAAREPLTPAPRQTEPAYGGTAPRVPEGSASGNLQERDLGVYITAGILAGTAAASIAYLYWSRRQRASARRLPGLSEARARLEGVRAASAAAQQALSAQAAQLAPRARSLSGRGTEAAARAQSRLGALRELMTDRVADLGGMAGSLGALGELARRQTRGTIRAVPSAGELRDTLAARLPAMPAVNTGTLRARMGGATESVQDWLDGMAGTVRGWTPALGRLTKLRLAGGGVRLALPALRWRPTRRAATKVAQTAAKQTATRKTRQVSRAARRNARRIGRQVRWFRRGTIAGAVWGILYAPVPGREARAAAARYLSRVPYLRDYIGTGEEVAGAVGGTGPHPRSDLATSHVPYPGTLGDTPLLEPTSEEPLITAPESDIGSIPGGSPTL